MENKYVGICPLMSTGKEIPEGCQEACCAWWVPEINGIHNNAPGHCAMLDLRALPYIGEAVRKI